MKVRFGAWAWLLKDDWLWHQPVFLHGPPLLARGPEGLWQGCPPKQPLTHVFHHSAVLCGQNPFLNLYSLLFR